MGSEKDQVKDEEPKGGQSASGHPRPDVDDPATRSEAPPPPPPPRPPPEPIKTSER
jgi:hypothetical protein